MTALPSVPVLVGIVALGIVSLFSVLSLVTFVILLGLTVLRNWLDVRVDPGPGPSA